MNRKKMIDDQEILLQGIEALNQSLGVAGALIFLSILPKNSTVLKLLRFDLLCFAN